ncbi:MAG: amino acid adenylation domain-containing protein [Planctomyces sp.]
MQTNVLEYLEERSLIRFPDHRFAEMGTRHCTFRELHDLAIRIASQLCRLSSRTTSPVCVYLPKGIETIIADMGILYSRNCYSNLDVKSPASRTAAILENLQPIAIITSAEYRDLLLTMGADAAGIILISEADALTEQSPATEELSRRRAMALDVDPVCIINTSGSTGIPKSVVMNHRNIIDFIDWTLDEFSFTEQDRFGSLSPLYFDIYTLEVYVAMATGACISLIPESFAAFPAKLMDYLAERRITFLFWVPSIMVTIANLGLLGKYDLSQLRRIFFAGEVFPTRQFNQWRAALTQAEFVNLYGPIEITVDCTFYRIQREFSDDEPLPIGFPCRNTEILILTEDNRPAEVGSQGELCVKGSSLAMGYWNNPERTSAAFVQNPLQKCYPERIYRTGDVASLNQSGEIMFHGRRDYQIKHLGFRIELGDIENAVVSTGLVDAACVLYHAAKKEIHLFYESASPIPAVRFREQLSALLPKYMLPTAFTHRVAFPLNPNGKIDRLRLQTEMLEHA